MKIRRGVPAAQYANPPGLPRPKSKRHPVRLSSGKRANLPDHDQLKIFYTTNPKGLAQWADKPHPWTSLFKIIRSHIPDLEFAKRVASRWFLDVFHETPAQHGAHLKGRAEWNEHLHPRDPHGEFAHVPGHKLLNDVEHAAHGGPRLVDPGQDKLKLAGKIDLDPGEHLVGSGKVSDRYGSVRLAATEKHGVRSLRIGVGNSTFGTREGGGPWTGGPDRHAEAAAEAAAHEHEHEQLESQLHDLPPGPQRDAVQKRLDDLEESDAGGEVIPGGFTALLDPTATGQLRAVLADVQRQAPDAQRRMEAAWESIPEGAVNFTPQLQAFDPGIDEYGTLTVADGHIPGGWGDLHYTAEIEEPDTGVRMRLAVVPHGMTVDEVRDLEAGHVLTLSDMAKLGRQVEALTAA